MRNNLLLSGQVPFSKLLRYMYLLLKIGSEYLPWTSALFPCSPDVVGNSETFSLQLQGIVGG